MRRKALGLDLKAVARNFGVDPSTVGRTASLFRSTGNVQCCYPKDTHLNKKLTKPVQLTILHTVIQWPDLTQTSDEVLVLTHVLS